MIDFDRAKNRIGTYAVKWDQRQEVFGDPDVLPMWVADTDFDAPEPVQDALIARVKQAPLGYTFIPDEFNTAISNWYKTRHGVTIAADNITPAASVMTSVDLLIQALTAKNDSVLMFDPVYFPFFNTVSQLQRKPLMFPLAKDHAGLHIDFDHLEAFVKTNRPKLMLLCNPHNPGGRVWDHDTLVHIGALMAKYNVPIISDEIHGDIIFPGQHFTAMLAACPEYRRHIYTLAAPTKTFNIAGLKCSYLISCNPKTTAAFKQLEQRGNYAEINTLAITALIAAYSQCGDYVDALNAYLYKNYQALCAGLDPAYDVMASEGTYLAFIKIPDGFSEDAFFQAAVANGIGIQKGSQFGENGRGYFRLNFGTQRKNIDLAIERLNRIVGANA
ncbi:MalY/PatB family protein [Lacticaseibacillus sp. GG6-2]